MHFSRAYNLTKTLWILNWSLLANNSWPLSIEATWPYASHSDRSRIANRSREFFTTRLISLDVGNPFNKLPPQGWKVNVGCSPLEPHPTRRRPPLLALCCVTEPPRPPPPTRDDGSQSVLEAPTLSMKTMTTNMWSWLGLGLVRVYRNATATPQQNYLLKYMCGRKSVSVKCWAYITWKNVFSKQ